MNPRALSGKSHQNHRIKPLNNVADQNLLDPACLGPLKVFDEFG
jgi:hypothetical protein